FHDIYSLDVLPIPTNQPVKRIDVNDSIFKTRREKYNSAISLIKERHLKGQPILVGTASVEASETVSRMLKLQKIPHAVLNAKYHRQEAEIVANAGQRGAVTIATNMAGRGTDIKLAPGVDELGGLMVIATERHLSRRVDRQLRGRCARQGDPGESKFFISFEDELMMKFGAAERMTSIMERFGMAEGEELQHPWLNKSVETAQKRVEQQHYVWRKRVLEYDDVMNQQREVVYDYRNEILESSDTRVLIDEALDKGVSERVSDFIPREGRSDTPIDYEGLTNWVNTTFPVGISQREAAFETKVFDEVVKYIIERVQRAYTLKIAGASPQGIQELERAILLNAVDRLWQEHLYALDALKEGVSLRTYGQKDPLVEFKSEAYIIFSELMRNINGEVLNDLFRGMAHLQALEQFLQAQAQQRHLQMTSAADDALESISDEPSHGGPYGGTTTTTTNTSEPSPVPSVPLIMLPSLTREMPKVGRNDPCPCGSGKKYKACHGRIA
ncbi:MAG: preprotein translocase, SecA subunit, partial [Verrucomicrobiaceae bacterium]|nr:preprotein translocase, SecA subunit [Verrucomicrobiaceae bacterium]